MPKGGSSTQGPAPLNPHPSRQPPGEEGRCNRKKKSSSCTVTHEDPKHRSFEPPETRPSHSSHTQNPHAKKPLAARDIKVSHTTAKPVPSPVQPPAPDTEQITSTEPTQSLALTPPPKAASQLHAAVEQLTTYKKQYASKEYHLRLQIQESDAGVGLLQKRLPEKPELALSPGERLLTDESYWLDRSAEPVTIGNTLPIVHLVEPALKTLLEAEDTDPKARELLNRPICGIRLKDWGNQKAVIEKRKKHFEGFKIRATEDLKKLTQAILAQPGYQEALYSQALSEWKAERANSLNPGPMATNLELKTMGAALPTAKEYQEELPELIFEDQAKRLYNQAITGPKMNWTLGAAIDQLTASLIEARALLP